MTRAMPPRISGAVHADPWVMLPPEEKAARVLPLLASGLSYGQVAERVGRDLGCYVVRSAIAGVVSRARERERGETSRDARRKGRERAAKARGGSPDLPVVPPALRASSDLPVVPPALRASPDLPVVPSALRASCEPRENSIAADRQPPSDQEVSRSCPDGRSAPLEAVIEAPAARPSSEAGGGGIPFDALRARSCRFPLWGDAARPGLDDMRFCGAETAADGVSWCADHRRVVTLRSSNLDRGRGGRNGNIRRAFASGTSVAAIAREHDLPIAAVERILDTAGTARKGHATAGLDPSARMRRAGW